MLSVMTGKRLRGYLRGEKDAGLLCVRPADPCFLAFASHILADQLLNRTLQVQLLSLCNPLSKETTST
jgi:hypothetical protein